jgi:hypothetical protein
LRIEPFWPLAAVSTASSSDDVTALVLVGIVLVIVFVLGRLAAIKAKRS